MHDEYGGRLPVHVRCIFDENLVSSDSYQLRYASQDLGVLAHHLDELCPYVLRTYEGVHHVQLDFVLIGILHYFIEIDVEVVTGDRFSESLQP